jgi:hypothetical protein
MTDVLLLSSIRCFLLNFFLAHMLTLLGMLALNAAMDSVLPQRITHYMYGLQLMSTA